MKQSRSEIEFTRTINIFRGRRVSRQMAALFIARFNEEIIPLWHSSKRNIKASANYLSRSPLTYEERQASFCSLDSGRRIYMCPHLDRQRLSVKRRRSVSMNRRRGHVIADWLDPNATSSPTSPADIEASRCRRAAPPSDGFCSLYAVAMSRLIPPVRMAQMSHRHYRLDVVVRLVVEWVRRR